MLLILLKTIIQVERLFTASLRKSYFVESFSLELSVQIQGRV